MTEPIVQEKMTLPQILSVFAQMDQGIIELSIDEMKEMGGKIATKIDGYKELLDRCDSEVIRLHKRADEFVDAANKINSTKTNVEKMLKYFMTREGIEKLPGENYSVIIAKRKSTSVNKITEESANSSLCARMPNFVRRKYAWDLNAIAAELKTTKPDAMLENRFELKTNMNEKVKFEVRKGIEK